MPFKNIRSDCTYIMAIKIRRDAYYIIFAGISDNCSRAIILYNICERIGGHTRSIE